MDRQFLLQQSKPYSTITTEMIQDNLSQSFFLKSIKEKCMANLKSRQSVSLTD